MMMKRVFLLVEVDKKEARERVAFRLRSEVFLNTMGIPLLIIPNVVYLTQQSYVCILIYVFVLFEGVHQRMCRLILKSLLLKL